MLTFSKIIRYLSYLSALLILSINLIQRSFNLSGTRRVFGEQQKKRSSLYFLILSIALVFPLSLLFCYLLAFFLIHSVSIFLSISCLRFLFSYSIISVFSPLSLLHLIYHLLSLCIILSLYHSPLSLSLMLSCSLSLIHISHLFCLLCSLFPSIIYSLSVILTLIPSFILDCSLSFSVFEALRLFLFFLSFILLFPVLSLCLYRPTLLFSLPYSIFPVYHLSFFFLI